MLHLLLLCLLFTGCREERLRLATTTSVENSGLLKALLPHFEKKERIKIDVIAVGSGAALRLGRNGDCDILIVHSKEDEEEFIKEGFGIERKEIMWNDFILLGPKKDPGKIRENELILGLKIIAKNKLPFVSRGDSSGTDKKEKALWKKAGVEPKNKWYLETGQGMGETLIIADEKQAYCLCDRGTYLAYGNKISLVILKENPKELYNPYSVIVINPKKYPINYKKAKKLADWLIKDEAQKIIGEYKINGIALFNPINKPSPFSSYITLPLEKARSTLERYHQTYATSDELP